jgi:hypothetical protein
MYRVKILEEEHCGGLEAAINSWLLDEAQNIENIVNISIAREYAGYGKTYSALIVYESRR